MKVKMRSTLKNSSWRGDVEVVQLVEGGSLRIRSDLEQMGGPDLANWTGVLVSGEVKVVRLV
jgi:hypothetical protein